VISLPLSCKVFELRGLVFDVLLIRDAAIDLRVFAAGSDSKLGQKWLHGDVSIPLHKIGLKSAMCKAFLKFSFLS